MNWIAQRWYYVSEEINNKLILMSASVFCNSKLNTNTHDNEI